MNALPNQQTLKSPVHLGGQRGLELVNETQFKGSATMGNLALMFNDVQFEVIDQNGQPWIKASELADALGYSDSKSINRIYSRNHDEFTANMTGVVKLTTPSGVQETRVFSLRGCYAVAMFARTPIAKRFRIWALDVLESLADKNRTVYAELNQVLQMEAISTAKGSFHGLGLYNRKKEKSALQAKLESCISRLQLTMSFLDDHGEAEAGKGGAA